VDEGLGPLNQERTVTLAVHDNEIKSNRCASFKSDVPSYSATAGAMDSLGNEKLSRKQQQKAKRKLKKQHAKELKRHKLEDNLTKEKISTSSSPLKIDHEAAPLRLHQFVSTVFRSELNVAENGAGYFIKNAPKVSAHHAILQGIVHLNGKVCKRGKTVLAYGDVVSLQLEPGSSREEGSLVAWRGSEEVAKKLEGERDRGERQGRMTVLVDAEASIQKDTKLSDCEMIKYYRDKLGKAWIPDVHESAIMQPLPLTLRVLKPSSRLAKELEYLGFSPVTEEDFSLRLSSLDGNETKLLSKSANQELLRDTWIAKGNNSLKTDDSSEKNLGIFLSEARVSGEIMQQELTSMLPVSIMTAHLKRQSFSQEKDLRFLDLCSAPGSKTCQLVSALDRVMSKNDKAEVDFTVVANEINPQRANWMRHRLHQQTGSKALSNLIITCADGRAYAKMEQNSFEYIVCDVPCSGDGTIRKSPKILGKWSPKNAAKNKPLQKELLKVGLGLLKPSDRSGNGGFLVYSTCSLNPLENEQVISEVLDELNGNSESEVRFELMDLSSEESPSPSSSSISNDCSSNPGHGNYLQVLPAKSHGGFFVAGIQKLLVARDDVNQVGDKHCKKKEITSNIHDKVLVTRHAQNLDETTIQYSISPSTQRCCTELIEKMGISTIISSGVAVLYESSNTHHGRKQILQQGCASLVSSLKQHHELLFGYVQLSHEEFLECHAKCSAHYEVLLPLADELQRWKSLDIGTPFIVKVGSSSSTENEDDQSCFLLPAEVVEVFKDNAAPMVMATITARPQIFSRSLFTL